MTINLRKGVSAVVFKDNKFLMVAGKAWPEGAWCFPQGGVNEEETHLQAIRRELQEEFGNDKFNIISKSKIDHSYEFPEHIKQKKGFDGQYQTIWFVEFLGDPKELKLNTEELSNLSWFEEHEIIPSMMFPEQKETFQKVLEELKTLRESKII